MRIASCTLHHRALLFIASTCREGLLCLLFSLAENLVLAEENLLLAEYPPLLRSDPLRFLPTRLRQGTPQCASFLDPRWTRAYPSASHHPSASRPFPPAAETPSRRSISRRTHNRRRRIPQNGC